MDRFLSSYTNWTNSLMREYGSIYGFTEAQKTFEYNNSSG